MFEKGIDERLRLQRQQFEAGQHSVRQKLLEDARSELEMAAGLPGAISAYRAYTAENRATMAGLHTALDRYASGDLGAATPIREALMRLQETFDLACNTSGQCLARATDILWHQGDPAALNPYRIQDEVNGIEERNFATEPAPAMPNDALGAWTSGPNAVQRTQLVYAAVGIEIGALPVFDLEGAARAAAHSRRRQNAK